MALLGLALMGNAFLYWSCQVQNSWANSYSTCDCNALVRKADSPKNAWAIGHSPKRFFQVNALYPQPTTTAVTLLVRMAKKPVPQNMPLLAGYPAKCFRPPCG